MPRSARLRLPSVPLHVLQRGHNRSGCFAGTNDFELYLALLQQFGNASGCRLHAYVLMTNHIHLLLTPEHPDSATRLMRKVNQRFVQHVNRRLKRTGSLWEGRFRSSPIESETYFLTCQRYIELNPVRAGMVKHPADYPWSSYRANAEGVASRLITPHSLYRALGMTDAERQDNYSDLCRQGISPSQLDTIRAAVRGGRPVAPR